MLGLVTSRTLGMWDATWSRYASLATSPRVDQLRRWAREMKIACITLVVVSLLMTGCASRFERIGIITVAQLAPRTASGEVFAGCYVFHTDHNRWPKTLDEIEDGLRTATREARYIRSLTNLMLTEDGEDLVVSYDYGTTTNIKMRMGPPKRERPNKSPQRLP